MMGYIPAAIFFAGMHAAVYGFSMGTMLFAFTMGYIWSRMIGLKTDKWFYGVLSYGFVISWHATYNVAIVAYGGETQMLLSFAGPWALVMLIVVLIAVAVLRRVRLRNEYDDENDDINGDDENTSVFSSLLLFRRVQKYE
jgi:hypothetical protein